MSLPRAVLLILYFLYGVCADEDVRVKLPLGIVEGYRDTSVYNDEEYFGFKGIRYTKKITEDTKFMNPEDPEPWEGILDATEEGNQCLQYNILINDVTGDIDCTFLNVYTPQLPEDGKECLPVMVFIHGGAFIFGSGSEEIYGADFFMKNRDVVLVTMNYRLAVQGFLNGQNKLAPGNVGLKDQSYALRWVNKYISYFGGCPDKVTIFGESAGSASVHYQLISNMSQGLFHGAIQQSGSATDLWAFTANSSDVLYYVAQLMGIDTDDKQIITEQLVKVPGQKIMEAFLEDFQKNKDNPFAALRFIPSLEVPIEGEESFLLETPFEAVARGHEHNVPTIIGVNTDEGLMFSSAIEDKLNELTDDDPMTMIESIPESELKLVPVDQRRDFAEQVLKLYTNTTSLKAMKKQDVVDLITDVAFFTQFTLVSKFRHHYKKPVYRYLFGYRTDEGGIKDFMDFGEGCMHGDELFLIFFSDMLYNLPDPDSVREELMLRFTKLWTNMAKTGQPTPPDYELDNIVTARWEPMENDNVMFISDYMEMRNSFYPERMALWTNIFKQKFGDMADII